MSEPRILVVDDEVDIRETLQAALELEGYSVGVASNGLEALEVLGGAEQPDLVLLDLMMPEMNGFQFLDRVRGNPELSKVPVVVVSAFGQFAWDSPGAELRAEAFIQKPIEFGALLNVVERHCRKAA